MRLTMINHGSIATIHPNMDSFAEFWDWVADNIGDDYIEWAGGLAVEHRYAHDLLAGLEDDGFVVEEG